MIYVGDKFKFHWTGHESSFEGRIYQVTSFIPGCTCGKYSYMTGRPEVPRRPHLHIIAKLIEAPRPEMIGEGNFWFGPLDEATLHDIEDHDNCLELVQRSGDELSLF